MAQPPTEVALNDAPLVRVLSQLRFPKITAIVKDDFIASFQEAIRKEYPILRPDEGQDILIGLEGVQSQAVKVWRFSDIEGKWRVSLGSEFLAIETVSYTSRNDFVERLERLLKALKDHIGPQTIDRLGVRYIDRFQGDAYDQLDSLIRGEVAGILSSELVEFSQQTISESIFRVPDEPWIMAARWGKLPAHATIDPNVLEPIETESWILDLDVFHAQARPLDVVELTAQVRFFAERIYTFFRWAVTEEFLLRYGGEK
ncbi:TIGR04255 family protein [Coleofasciculus sp. H7-2]|uniref:TIGR04255 family protein n=1 Tax=Coleofasciculus sp. H7-2 TaxID=3351545 RepID=UPI00366D0493